MISLDSILEDAQLMEELGGLYTALKLSIPDKINALVNTVFARRFTTLTSTELCCLVSSIQEAQRQEAKRQEAERQGTKSQESERSVTKRRGRPPAKAKLQVPVPVKRRRGRPCARAENVSLEPMSMLHSRIEQSVHQSLAPTGQKWVVRGKHIGDGDLVDLKTDYDWTEDLISVVCKSAKCKTEIIRGDKCSYHTFYEDHLWITKSPIPNTDMLGVLAVCPDVSKRSDPVFKHRDTIIANYGGVKVSDINAHFKSTLNNSPYAIVAQNANPKVKYDGIARRSIASLLNRSKQSNAYLGSTKNIPVIIHNLKKVYHLEEVTVSYGYDPLDEFEGWQFSDVLVSNT
jgi:hypothetical protein